MKPVKGWAIVDSSGFYELVVECDSSKFIWRKFVGSEKLFSQDTYEKYGYRCIPVLITPITK